MFRADISILGKIFLYKTQLFLKDNWQMPEIQQYMTHGRRICGTNLNPEHDNKRETNQ